MPDAIGLLLRLYPRLWRDRYGAELSSVLERERLTLRVVLDLLAGAIDARLDPQPIVKGGDMARPFLRCGPVTAARADQWKSTAVLLLGSTISALLYMFGRRRFPEAKPYLELLVYAGFPVSVVLSSYWTYLKPYSQPARIVVIIAASLAVVGILAVAVAIASRL